MELASLILIAFRHELQARASGVISDPLKGSNIFKDLSDVPSSVFDSPSKLANYLKNLPADKLNDLSFYGREVKWLSENNYLYDVSNFKFLK